MYWNWKLSGLALGLAFFAAVALIKPIGVSTQFVIADGIVADTLNHDLVTKSETAKHGYASSNAYLNKSGGKYAKNIANPLNYGLIFVLCMIPGGLIGKLTSRTKDKQPDVPTFHKERFGNTTLLRYVLSFVGGFLVLWGARMAGGCSSGHMMSGIMQTSLSGYFFSIAVFATAIPTAILLYKKGDH
jgi:hypothetical protein